MRVLTLREFERAPIREVATGETPEVTRQEVGALDALQRRQSVEWFRLAHRHVSAGGWVGSFAVGRRVYEILPKIDSADLDGARRNVHLMMAAGDLLKVEEAGLAPLLRRGRPLLNAYLELYVRRLALEWRRGPLRRYEVIEENVPFVRGKLLVRRQVRENAVRRERLACARDEFTPDNLPARLLKAAARTCARQEFAPDVAGAARSLLVDMDEVGDTYVPGPAIRAPLERQHQRFEPLLRMAALILDSESPSMEAGGEKTFALMFEMHAVFEAFIAAELRRALGPAYRVRAQAGPRALLQRATPAGWTPAFQLRPDVTIQSVDGSVGLIDTKWKRLDGSRRWNDVAQSDIYQMYAYAMRYRAPKTILVYPRIEGFGREVDDFRIEPGPGSDVARILVRTVDVSGDLEAPSVRQQLLADLRAIVSA